MIMMLSPDIDAELLVLRPHHTVHPVREGDRRNQFPRKEKEKERHSETRKKRVLQSFSCEVCKKSRATLRTFNTIGISVILRSHSISSHANEGSINEERACAVPLPGCHNSSF